LLIYNFVVIILVDYFMFSV